MTPDAIQSLIRRSLDKQHRGESFTPGEHLELLELVDMGHLGMDGFKYCLPEVAKENRRKMLASTEYRWSEATIRKRLSA